MNTFSMRQGIPRPIEVAVALLGLVVAAPIIALAGIAVALTSPGPMFFRQERVGQKGRIFLLYKLRTMRVSDQGLQITAGDDNRVTRVGSLLRHAKIDELPQLWNILLGDMSLVGPRPEVPRYVDLENPMWKLVLEAKPGITDPMTLRLRNEEVLLANVKGDREQFYLATLQPVKLKGYLEYLYERSWSCDVKVLCKTIVAIFFPSKSPLPISEENLDEHR